MAYLTLYRAWRPERFSDVVEQTAIISALRKQVSTGRISHAYLFCGSRGTGKTTCAKLLARAINCTNPHDGEPCGVCSSCVSIARETTLDVIEIDAASNNGVDDVRALREQVKYPPSGCKYKVYIIDEVHMLSGGAFNALLKTLEEPPEYVVFILATTEPQRLPATILSRCQRYEFARISVDGIMARLKAICAESGISAQDAALSRIARAAQGGMRDAISTLDACLSGGGALTDDYVRGMLGASDRGHVDDILCALLNLNNASALTAIDDALRTGADINVLTREIAARLREMLLALAYGQDVAALSKVLEIGDDEAHSLINMAQNTPLARVIRAADIFMSAESDMKWAAQPRFILELCALRAAQPENDWDMPAIVQRVEALESAPRPAIAREVLKPREPAAPKTTTENQSTPNADNEEARYKNAIAIVKKQDPTIQALLKPLRFVKIEDGCAVLAYTNDSDRIFVTALQKEEKARALSAALTEAFGTQTAVKYIKNGEEIPPPSTPLKSTVGQTASLFGMEPEIFTEE